MVPWVRVTRVLPTLRTENMVGALMSYQSFLVKGSTLHKTGAHGGGNMLSCKRGARLHTVADPLRSLHWLNGAECPERKNEGGWQAGWLRWKKETNATATQTSDIPRDEREKRGGGGRVPASDQCTIQRWFARFDCGGQRGGMGLGGWNGARAATGLPAD